MSLSLEDKIALKQEEIQGVSIEELDEAIKRKKCELFSEIVGGEKFIEIDKKGMNINNKYESLREVAKEESPESVEKIDEWDLTESQKDYLFVQSIMVKIAKGGVPLVSEEDFNRLKEIKEKVQFKQNGEEETDLVKETRRILTSSRMNIIFNLLNNKSNSEREQNLNKEKGE